MATLNYAAAGVDREAADRLVERISALTRSTLNKQVKSHVGGYASLYALDARKWIAASTDGVGTKLKLAFELGVHDTVGIDLVAMSVNDLICVGAEPLFFLDYFATGELNADVAEKVLEGIVEGCRQARCALVGGETAEMPDMYAAGEYDLAGFAVGQLKPSQALPRRDLRAGDVLIGIASSGCHSNGYSLLRKLLPSEPGASREGLARDLLTPTRIYVRALEPLLASGKIKGLAHITGSGFLNVPRISPRFSYSITLPPLEERATIYRWVYERSALPLAELAQTFNLGIGMVAAVAPRNAKEVLRALKKRGERAWLMGEVVNRKRGKGSQVVVSEGSERVVLDYGD